jgi:two-component system heavy metal sensor histidine kinase CusS
VADDALALQLRRAASLLQHDEELRRKKRVLASLVVHDLRSPLSGAVSYLDLIKDELATATPERLRVLVDDARELMMKALSLVATILDVDELEDGMLRATPQPLKLAGVIAKAWTTSLANAQIRDLRFDTSVGDALEVELDPDLFDRVVENLFDNAVRYAPRAGRVAAAAAIEGGMLELTIGNDGPAVPEAEREAIFGRYHQVEARRASARANRGLGLYFCRLAIEAHGGTITVEERGELRTTFVVRIPQPPVLPIREESGRHRRPSDPDLNRVRRPSDPNLGKKSTGEVPAIPKPKPDE